MLGRWLARLARLVAHRPIARHRPPPRPPADRVALAPSSVEAQMDPEQRRALERVRQIYHTGSQPLTVARARYDLIRRGVFDGA
jgi:hypothetical protein